MASSFVLLQASKRIRLSTLQSAILIAETWPFRICPLLIVSHMRPTQEGIYGCIVVNVIFNLYYCIKALCINANKNKPIFFSSWK